MGHYALTGAARGDSEGDGTAAAGVAVSAGAACSSGKVHESHVLKAMKAGPHAGRAIRVSGGWNSSKPDFAKLAEVLVAL